MKLIRRNVKNQFCNNIKNAHLQDSVLITPTVVLVVLIVVVSGITPGSTFPDLGSKTDSVLSTFSITGVGWSLSNFRVSHLLPSYCSEQVQLGSPFGLTEH